MTKFPWDTKTLAKALLDGSGVCLDDKNMAHHLAKASVERWFAFELAAALDPKLAVAGWTCLVECGGGGKFGNFDLLIVPTESTSRKERVRLEANQWPSNAVAVEIKVAQLSDGPGAYPNALVEDLTKKPDLAATNGRPCAAWFGVLVTTDGLCKGSPNAAKTAERGKLMAAGELPLDEHLLRLGVPETRAVQYGDWEGHVWAEVVVAKSDK